MQVYGVVKKFMTGTDMQTYHRSTTPVTKVVSCATIACFIYSFVLHAPAMALASMAEDHAAVRSLKAVPERVVIPARYGRVTGMHEGDARRLVVYVQDLHCNPEVQRNIAGILNVFEQKYGIRRIYVEGAPAGRLDTGLLASIPDDTVREKTIEGLVSKGLLSGSEYYALKYRQDKLFGLEDWGIYRENLARYRTLTGRKTDHAAVLSRLRAEIAVLNEKYLDRKLKRVQKVLVGGRQESRYLRMENMGRRVGHPVSGYPNLARYLSAIKLSRAIRYNRVNDELGRYLKDLQGRLSFDAYSALTRSMNDPDGRDAFYFRLAAVVKNSGTDSRRYPDVARFLAYLELNTQINPVQLIAEETLFMRRVLEQHAVRKMDRDLLLLTRMANDAVDFVGLTMTPDQYRRFSADKDRFITVMRKYCGPSVARDALSVLTDAACQEFYAANVRRNAVFLQSLDCRGDANASSAPVTNGSSVALSGSMLSRVDRFGAVDFVIAGGFHMDMAKLLRDNNISYLLITPGMTQSHDAAVYEQLMSGTIDYKRLASSALAPIADSLGVEPGVLVAMVEEMVLSSLRSGLTPDQCAEILTRWRSGQEKLKDISISYDVATRTFGISVRAGGVESPVLDIIAHADGSVSVASHGRGAPAAAGMNDAAGIRAVARYVREKMTELSWHQQVISDVTRTLESLLSSQGNKADDVSGEPRLGTKKGGILKTIDPDELLLPDPLDFSSTLPDALQEYEQRLLEISNNLSREFLNATPGWTSLPPVLMDGVPTIQRAIKAFLSLYDAREADHVHADQLSTSYDSILRAHDIFIGRYNSFVVSYNVFLAAEKEAGYAPAHYAPGVNITPLLLLGDLRYWRERKIQFEGQASAALAYFGQIVPQHLWAPFLNLTSHMENVIACLDQCTAYYENQHASHLPAATDEVNDLLRNVTDANEDFVQAYDKLVDDYNGWVNRSQGPAPLTGDRRISARLGRIPGGHALATAGMVIEEILIAPVRELAEFSSLAQLYLTDRKKYYSAARSFVAPHRYRGAAYTPDQTARAMAGLTEIIGRATTARHPILALTRLWAGHLVFNYRNGTLGMIRHQHFAPVPLSRQAVSPSASGASKLDDFVVRSGTGYFQQTLWLLPWFPGMISLRLRDDVSADTRAGISGEVIFIDKNGAAEAFPLIVRDGKLEAPYVLSGERYDAGMTYPFIVKIRVGDTAFSLKGTQTVETPWDEQWTYAPMAREIVPGTVYLGNALAVATRGFLSGKGVGAVLNVAEERDTRYHAISENMAYAHFEFNDFTNNPLDADKLWQAVLWMHEQIQAGSPVFVHCHAGIGRSSSLVIAYLALVLYPEKNFDEIVAMVRRAKPDIYPHLGLPNALLQLRSRHQGKLQSMYGRKAYPAAVENGTVTDVAFSGVKAGDHIPARVGEPVVIRANIAFTGPAPRGVRLRTDINRAGDHVEILMRQVGDSSVYEATLMPRRAGSFWVTVSATPNEHDHYLTSRTWVSGNIHDIYVDVAAAEQAGISPAVVSRTAHLFADISLAPNVLPSVPRRIFRAIARFIAGSLNEERTWFEQRVRQEPAVFAQKSVLIHIPRWDGVTMTPELRYLLDNHMNPVVLTGQNVDDASSGNVIGRVTAGSRTLVVRMKEAGSLVVAGNEHTAGPVVLTLAPDTDDSRQGLTQEELRGALSDLLSDVLDGMLSDVVDAPWLVMGTDLQPFDLGQAPVVLAREALNPADDTDGQKKYFEKLMSQYAETISSQRGAPANSRSVRGVTRGRAGIMVQAHVAKIIDPVGVHADNKIAAAESFARALRQRGISQIGLDGLLTVTSHGEVRFDGMPLDQFDALYAALGGVAGETELVLPLTVPAGIDSPAFVRNLAALMAAHPGMGIRIRFEDSGDTAKTLDALGVALFRAKVPSETTILVDCNDSAQPAYVAGAAAQYGLRMIPLGDREHAVEITVGADADATDKQFAAALRATRASLVVVTLSDVPLMGDTESFNFGDILSVLSMYLAGRRVNSPDEARLKGVRHARSAIAAMGNISFEDAGTIAQTLIASTHVHNRAPLNDFTERLSGKLPDHACQILSSAVDNIVTFNPSGTVDTGADSIRAAMLDGFVTELLGEMLVRRIPGYDQIDRDAMETNGQREILKQGLVALATTSQQDSLLVNLASLYLGIVPREGTVDSETTREQVLTHANPVVRYFALRTLRALAGLPASDPRCQAVMADMHTAADEMSRVSGTETDMGDTIAGARALAASTIVPRDSTVSAEEVITGARNQAAMLMNRGTVPPESCALLMLVTLDLLNTDSRKGLAETVVQNAQPALRAISMLLSAA